MAGDHFLVHLIRRNPLFDAVRENDQVLLSVAGDWAFIPSSWKAIGAEDPRRGIPTTYYAAVQLEGTAEILEAPDDVARPFAPSSPTYNPPRPSSILRSTAPGSRRSAACTSRSPRCGPSSSTGATSIRPTATPF